MREIIANTGERQRSMTRICGPGTARKRSLARAEGPRSGDDLCSVRERQSAKALGYCGYLSAVGARLGSSHPIVDCGPLLSQKPQWIFPSPSLAMAGLFFSPGWSQTHRCVISSLWRQSLVGMTVASWAIGDDHCARIHASSRSRRLGRFVRHAMAGVLGTRRPSATRSVAPPPRV